MIAYIALGSNLEDRHNLLKTALEKMQQNNIKIIQKSEIIETKAYGKTDQPDFLNQVVKVSTMQEPYTLLETLNKIEKELGRVRKEHWGARTIDLDIIFYEDLVMTSQRLTIPHYDMQHRDFVLSPMVELSPDYIHPVLKKSMQELLEELKNK